MTLLSKFDWLMNRTVEHGNNSQNDEKKTSKSHQHIKLIGNHTYKFNCIKLTENAKGKWPTKLFARENDRKMQETTPKITQANGQKTPKKRSQRCNNQIRDKISKNITPNYSLRANIRGSLHTDMLAPQFTTPQTNVPSRKNQEHPM